MIYAIFQAVVLTLIIGFCLVQVLRKLWPDTSRALQAKIFRKLGLAAPAPEAPAGGCGSGCDSCKACSRFKIEKL